jgi:hypothetical protein
MRRVPFVVLLGAALLLPACTQKPKPQPPTFSFYPTPTLVKRAFWVPIEFEHGSAELGPSQRRALDEDVIILREHPDLSVALYSIADDLPDEDANARLAAQRLQAVREGVPPFIGSWRLCLGLPPCAERLVAPFRFKPGPVVHLRGFPSCAAFLQAPPSNTH